MYSDLIQKAKQLYPNIELKSSDEFFSWFNSIVPDFVLYNIVEPKCIKNCGGLSSKFAILGLSLGFPCFTLYGPGHTANVVLTSDGIYEIDFSHLQFDFSFGGLRDFSKLDREEYHKEEFEQMKELFKEIEKNPMKAVKIIKLKSINPDYLSIEKSTFSNEIFNLFKSASSLIFE